MSHLTATTQEHIVSVRKVLSLILILDDKKEVSDIPKEKRGGTLVFHWRGRFFVLQNTPFVFLHISRPYLDYL